MEYEIKVPGILALAEEEGVSIHGENHTGHEHSVFDPWKLQRIQRLYGHEYVQEGIDKEMKGKKFDEMSHEEILDTFLEAVEKMDQDLRNYNGPPPIVLPERMVRNLYSWGYIPKKEWEVAIGTTRGRLDCEWVSRRAGDIARTMR